MSALNMAMNGNAYKMIEIKKVTGPVVPLTSLNPLNPLTTLTDRYEPLPNPQNQVKVNKQRLLSNSDRGSRPTPSEGETV